MPLFIVEFINECGALQFEEIQASSEEEASEWVMRELNATEIIECRPE